MSTTNPAWSSLLRAWLGCELVASGGTARALSAADLAMMGEIGLSGELRSVGYLPRGLNEAAKLGFTRVLVPKTAVRKLDLVPAGLEILGARTLREALEMALMPGPGEDEDK